MSTPRIKPAIFLLCLLLAFVVVGYVWAISALSTQEENATSNTLKPSLNDTYTSDTLKLSFPVPTEWQDGKYKITETESVGEEVRITITYETSQPYDGYSEFSVGEIVGVPTGNPDSYCHPKQSPKEPCFLVPTNKLHNNYYIFTSPYNNEFSWDYCEGGDADAQTKRIVRSKERSFCEDWQLISDVHKSITYL